MNAKKRRLRRIPRWSAVSCKFLARRTNERSNTLFTCQYIILRIRRGGVIERTDAALSDPCLAPSFRDLLCAHPARVRPRKGKRAPLYPRRKKVAHNRRLEGRRRRGHHRSRPGLINSSKARHFVRRVLYYLAKYSVSLCGGMHSVASVARS